MSQVQETVTAAGKAFGVTPSSVSRHLVEATAKQLVPGQRVSALRDVPRHGPRGGQAFPP